MTVLRKHIFVACDPVSTICYKNSHINNHLILLIDSSMKSMIIGIKRLLIKPQYCLHFIICTSCACVFSLCSVNIVDSDIIELSSDEEDVLLTKDEDSDVDPEDPNNAGNHINDALNAHDDFGRVLVNIGHPSDEPDIFLAPQIARYIKKHQVRSNTFKMIKVDFVNRLDFFMTIIVNCFLFVDRWSALPIRQSD